MNKVYLLFRILLLFLGAQSSYAWSSDISAQYLLDYYQFHTQQSGTSDSEVLGSFIIEAEFKKSDWSFLMGLVANHSTGSPSRVIEDQQVVSNIDTQGGEGVKPFQVYGGKSWGSLELRLGLIDLSTTFNITDSSTALINSSFGTSADFGGAGVAGPAIFPIPSWGLVSHFEKDHFYQFFAFMDPIAEEDLDPSQMVTRPQIDSHHLLSVLEVGLKDIWFEKIGAGFWSLNDDRADVLYKQQGMYLLGEKAFGKNTLFLRLSRASKIEEKIYQNTVFGIKRKGLILENDGFNLGFSSIKIEARDLNEQVYEALYEFGEFVKKNYTVNPMLGVQHIDHVGGFNRNAQILTIRFDIKLNSK